MNNKPNTKTLLSEENLWKPMKFNKNASLNSEKLSLKIWNTCSCLKDLSLTEAFFEKVASFYIKSVTQILIFFLNLQRNDWHIIICTDSLAKIVILIVNIIDKSKTDFCSKNLLKESIIYQNQSNFYKLHQISSFEIASRVIWNSLPILPSKFGLSSQNIRIPHYPCHSVYLILAWKGLTWRFSLYQALNSWILLFFNLHRALVQYRDWFFLQTHANSCKIFWNILYSLL